MPRADFWSVFKAGVLAAGLTATPSPACTVSTAGVAFGAYDILNPAPHNGVGSISLVCFHRDRPEIAIGSGQWGSFTQRKMANGNARLNYNLYTNASRTIVWGDGSNGTATVSPSGVKSGSNRHYDVTVYGGMPAAQNVAAGTYADVLFVTVIF